MSAPVDFKGRLSNGDITRYALAGKATLTIRNRNRDTRFTYRLTAPMNKETGKRDFEASIRFVAVLTGPENTTDFSYIGFIRDGKFYHGGAKSRASAEAPSVIAFGWFWKNIERLPDAIEIWHEGVCGRCGRKLTVPESIADGMGPECSGRRLAAAKAKGTRKAMALPVAPPAAPPVREVSKRHGGMTLDELRRAVRNGLEGKCPDGCCGGENGKEATAEEVEREMQRIEAESDRAQTEREAFNSSLDEDYRRERAKWDAIEREEDERERYKAALADH